MSKLPDFPPPTDGSPYRQRPLSSIPSTTRTRSVGCSRATYRSRPRTGQTHHGHGPKRPRPRRRTSSAPRSALLRSSLRRPPRTASDDRTIVEKRSWNPRHVEPSPVRGSAARGSAGAITAKCRIDPRGRGWPSWAVIAGQRSPSCASAVASEPKGVRVDLRSTEPTCRWTGSSGSLLLHPGVDREVGGADAPAPDTDDPRRHPGAATEGGRGDGVPARRQQNSIRPLRTRRNPCTDAAIAREEKQHSPRGLRARSRIHALGAVW